MIVSELNLNPGPLHQRLGYHDDSLSDRDCAKVISIQLYWLYRLPTGCILASFARQTLCNETCHSPVKYSKRLYQRRSPSVSNPYAQCQRFAGTTETIGGLNASHTIRRLCERRSSFLQLIASELGLKLVQARHAKLQRERKWRFPKLASFRTNRKFSLLHNRNDPQQCFLGCSHGGFDSGNLLHLIPGALPNFTHGSLE